MNDRITAANLRSVAESVADELKDHGFNGRYELIMGSKHYGNSFKFVEIVEGCGHKYAPGTVQGFVGWTKREAYDTLWTILRTLQDLRWAKEGF